MNVIARQQQEHLAPDDFRDQLVVYKRMRQQHQRQLQQLESRLQAEMQEHKRNLDKESENQLHQLEKEMEKLRAKHKGDLEAKVSLKQMVRKNKCLYSEVHNYEPRGFCFM